MKWRPIKTAPKIRGEKILIAALNGDDEFYVVCGCWVDVPHNNQLTKSWMEGGTRQAQEIECEKDWRDGRVAILQSGGACNGYTYEARSDAIFEPTHWMPMPQPPKTKPKRRR